MRIVLEEEFEEGALRVDRAWELFFGSKSSLTGGPWLDTFANWLWHELGEKAGYLNKKSKGELTVTIPLLEPDALDFLLRLVSFWADEVHVKRTGTLSENLWKKPVVNLLDDEIRHGAERVLTHSMDNAGSKELNLMPLLGPGRSFFSVQVLEKGEFSARMHSHSAVDEYYLILEGKGTLRNNGKEIEVRRGDLIGKPAGPDAATQLLANRGERLRILDMEVWHQSAHFSKDTVRYPDSKEIMMRGQGWGAIIPEDSLRGS
jgi:uncharacterized cupin superfamily protein